LGIWISKEYISPGIEAEAIIEPDTQPEIRKRMSLGEKRLTQITTPAKEKAIKAYREGNYGAAITEFEASLKQKLNDPESLVYLNNAKAEIADRNPIKIAISIPLGTAPPIAMEMLRGTAQIQNEVNNDGGITGGYLQVVIMDDDNNPEIGKQIAQAVVQDPDTIAVVGSNTTEVSRVTSEIYQSGGVVMVNPTSWGDGITGADKDYIFRAVSSPDLMAQKLAQDVSDTFGESKIAICYDDSAQDNMSFKNVFIKEFLKLGGSILDKENGFDCQFNAPFFNANSLVEEAKESGAEGLLLAPHINKLEPALSIARENDGELSLFSSTSLYTGKVLEEGQDTVNGLTFYAPWHPDIDPDNKFYVEGKELWKGRFNWRTATTLEATLAVVEGLKQASEPTRNQLKQVMRQPNNFEVDGISPTPISFSNGDREGEPVKVQVQPGGNLGYDFVLQKE
ncbi:MAG: ABC transporter substrate-binding protein, partial [Cyanobacteria bacterium J06558_2]